MLILGYGNTLCGDDGVGVYVAQALLDADLPDTVRVVTAYQLLPEMAADIYDESHVIFVDARVGHSPGEITREVIRPDKRMDSPGHHLLPARLLGLTCALYGTCPEAVLFTMTGRDFDPGDSLSEPVRAHLPDLIERVRHACRVS
jgi:hydrogenase maturation protease